MPGVIVAETMQVGTLPGIWSPVQWELGEEERREELEDQARASLLAAVDTPEAVLRLLLDETEIVRVFGPPEGYDPEQQGEWDDSLVTFAFKRTIKLDAIERRAESLTVSYKLEGAGYWLLEIGPEKVVIERS
ncbi:MAG: hypothetical protein A2Y93_16865 [Chloroflexi bacterium RBG_13_68_17]|jgi:hypothetical protein|nr:MAG: hypothetical protein A2Y93_16865 [Chloroflexi bacterium RBG_13_68_17]